MININELKAGNQVGFKVTLGDSVLHNTGTLTAIEKDTVRIDELVLHAKDLIPILLTNDTLVKIGCVQLSSGTWRTADFTGFEFDGLLAKFSGSTTPVCYLHLFQNTVSRQVGKVSV